MTKKDYELIADVIHRNKASLSRKDYNKLVDDFCKELERNNSRFNSYKFRAAYDQFNTEK